MNESIACGDLETPILVVDDKKENLYSFKTILSNAGFKVVTALSGMEALKYLMSNSVSLVLLDVQMPEMNGFETAQLIRQSERHHSLPIVFISATRNTDDFVKQGFSVGAYEYLSKPIDNQILINKVKIFQTLYCQHKELEARFRATEALNDALQSNEKLQATMDQANQANRAKDDFLASMSHELRTPLTTVLGNSQYLLDRGICGGDQCIEKDAFKALQSIHGAATNQLLLVNDILDMSKIESGKCTTSEAPYDLNQLLISIEQMLSKKAADQGIDLLIDHTIDEQFQLIGDVHRIQQILINLLGNAIKFTEKGHVSLTVKVIEESLVFTVKDTGIGISPEEQQYLFKRFEQVDESISKRFGGTGLGLYISQKLAQLMEGQIEVSSVAGEGATFTLTLPYRRSEEVIVTIEHSNSPAAPQQIQLKGNLLVAEDLPDLQDVERRILEAMGIDVTFANNGQEAVDAAMRQSFDLILMDMQMPIMDGIEATRTLREQGSKTPIVALTGNVMQKHHDQFVAAGCNNFVTKPIENEELVAVLKQHLETTSGELLAENQPVAIISPPSSEEDITASGVGTSAVEKEVQKRFSVLLHDFGNQLMPIQSQLARDFHIRKMLKTLVKGLEEQQQKVDAGEEPLTTLGQVGAVLSEIEKTNLGDQLDRAQATTNKMAAAIKEQGQKLINRES